MALRGQNPHWKMHDLLRRYWNESSRRNGLGIGTQYGRTSKVDTFYLQVAKFRGMRSQKLGDGRKRSGS